MQSVARITDQQIIDTLSIDERRAMKEFVDERVTPLVLDGGDPDEAPNETASAPEGSKSKRKKPTNDSIQHNTEGGRRDKRPRASAHLEDNPTAPPTPPETPLRARNRRVHFEGSPLGAMQQDRSPLGGGDGATELDSDDDDDVGPGGMDVGDDIPDDFNDPDEEMSDLQRGETSFEGTTLGLVDEQVQRGPNPSLSWAVFTQLSRSHLDLALSVRQQLDEHLHELDGYGILNDTSILDLHGSTLLRHQVDNLTEVYILASNAKYLFKLRDRHGMDAVRTVYCELGLYNRAHSLFPEKRDEHALKPPGNFAYEKLTDEVVDGLLPPDGEHDMDHRRQVLHTVIKRGQRLWYLWTRLPESSLIHLAPYLMAKGLAKYPLRCRRTAGEPEDGELENEQELGTRMNPGFEKTIEHLLEIGIEEAIAEHGTAVWDEVLLSILTRKPMAYSSGMTGELQERSTA